MGHMSERNAVKATALFGIRCFICFTLVTKGMRKGDGVQYDKIATTLRLK